MIAAWRIGFNDPDPLGYLTTGGYLAGSILCFAAARSARGASPEARGFGWFWRILAAGFLLLGINKQLDLQDELRQVGSEMARAEGWYEQRRRVQFILAAIIVTLVLGMLGWLLTKGRRYVSKFPLACVGAVLVVGYAVIRACAFSHTAGWVKVFSLNEQNWVWELAGILCVAVAAIRARAAFQSVTPPPPGDE